MGRPRWNGYERTRSNLIEFLPTDDFPTTGHNVTALIVVMGMGTAFFFECKEFQNRATTVSKQGAAAAER